MSRCPRCNCEATGENRLVTDSCGHNKCRQCLLADVSDCLECRLMAPLEEDLSQVEKEVSLTDCKSHGDNIEITPDGYRCTVCNKSFRSRTQQYYHRACGNEKLKKFNCPQCSRRFSSHSHLKYHLNSHSQGKRYSCPSCDKSYQQQSVLRRHMLIHKSDKLACDQCQKLFRTAAALSTHKLIHTGESLPYKCDICSRHYLTKANLKQHRLKHDQNSIRHNCSICNKSFLRQTTLRLHQKRHAKRAIHSCPHCCKAFNDVDALARHIKQHTATERYRCTQCDVMVNRKDNMIRHLRSMHPGTHFEAGVEVIGTEQSIQTAADPMEVVQVLRYNSVIKSVGNVEPVNVTLPQQRQRSPPALEPEIQAPIGVPPTIPEKLQKENVKLYRKIILDLDNEELTNTLEMEDAIGNVVSVQQVTMQENHVQTQHQTQPGHGSSNFSERHWRKSFYCYEKEHIN